MKRFRRGLVVGKFAPLHLGHERMVAAAREACDEVVVLSYARPERAGCEPERRAGWLAARFPFARSIVVTDAWLAARGATRPVPADDADDATHRHFVGWILCDLLDSPVDAVFTSEAYGPGLAEVLTGWMRATDRSAAPVVHVAVDPERREVPISATRIRADVHAHRRWLAPEVRASFVRRIALLGGESSGKTTLAAALAARLGTAWVPEAGRERWEERGGRLEPGDMLAIAEEQIAREERACLGADRLVVCDTTPLTTCFYAAALFGSIDPRLAALAARPYDVTILCAPDFPFVQDGTRQDDAFRARQHAYYVAELGARGVEWVPAAGPVEARIAAVLARL